MGRSTNLKVGRSIICLRDVAEWFKLTLAEYGVSTFRLNVYEYLGYFVKELLDSTESGQIEKSSCRTTLLRLGLDISTVAWIEHRMYLELIERLDGVFEKIEDLRIKGALYSYSYDVVGRNYDLVFNITEDCECTQEKKCVI